MKKVFIIFFVLLVIGKLMSSSEDQPAGTAIAASAVKEAPKSLWKDGGGIDNMTGKDNTYSALVSQNTQQVGVLNDSVKAQIVVWKNISDGSYPAAITFNKSSQPRAYTSYDSCFDNDCFMLVRLDGGQTQSVKIYEGSSSDRSSRVFISDKSMVKRIQAAKKIEIRIAFFRQGDGNFIFINDGK